MSECLAGRPGLSTSSALPLTQRPNPANTGSSSAQHPRPPPPVYQQGYSFGQTPHPSGLPNQTPIGPNASTSSQQGFGSMTNTSITQQFYILLGAHRGRRSVEIGYLDNEKARDDGAFFVNVKTEYQRLRGYLRCWFSIWGLSHCDFVKVR